MLTDPISHPGRLLKREFGVRRLSANRLALDLGAPSSRARTSSVGAVRSLPTKPYGLALTLGVFRKPGGKSGSPGDADGVEIKATEMEVDGVAESFAVAEAAR